MKRTLDVLARVVLWLGNFMLWALLGMPFVEYSWVPPVACGVFGTLITWAAIRTFD
jgi:hypothetical protein